MYVEICKFIMSERFIVTENPSIYNDCVLSYEAAMSTLRHVAQH